MVMLNTTQLQLQCYSYNDRCALWTKHVCEHGSKESLRKESMSQAVNLLPGLPPMISNTSNNYYILLHTTYCILL